MNNKGWLEGFWSREEYALACLRQLWQFVVESDMEYELKDGEFEIDGHTVLGSRIADAVHVALDNEQWATP